MKLIYKKSKSFADVDSITVRIAELEAKLNQQQLNARNWLAEHNDDEAANSKIAIMRAEAEVTRAEIEVQKVKLRHAKELESVMRRLQYAKNQLKIAKD